MPRFSRKSLKSNYFHVVTQGIDKSYIFEKNKYKENYKEMLIEKLKMYKLNLLAYCIMDNHAHLLIHARRIEELSRYMQSVNTSFAIYYNKSNKRVGYVFRNRFKSEEVKTLGHLHRALIYIHLNPVAAGICRNPELYFYSSYNDYIKMRGIASSENIELLKFIPNNFCEEFKFIHTMRVKGLEYEKMNSKRVKEERIMEYIKENEIIDVIFQSEKIKKMINDLKKEKISFSQIATFLSLTPKRLKEIISE